MATDFPALRLVVFLAGFGLTGCEGVGGKYGSYWDGPHYNSAVNFMPENAPSMRNRYYLASESGRASENEHLGLDITGSLSTPVLAAASGVVTKAFFEPLYGNHVVISHGQDAAGRKLNTSYVHLQAQSVSVGERVSRGQQIGTLGRTGLLAAGILHLHFQFDREDRRGRMIPQDPNQHWVNGSGVITCFDEGRDWPDSPFGLTYPVECR